MEKILKQTLETGAFDKVSPLRSKIMKAVKAKGNKSTELQFRMALIRAKISGWTLHAKLLGKPDFFFKDLKVAIFLDGCFWHGCPLCGHIPKTNSLYWQTKIARNLARDQKNTVALESEGYTVLRFWEHELQGDMQECIAKFLALPALIESLRPRP